MVHVSTICYWDFFLDFEPVLVTVAYLFEANPAAEFWCTYQVRRLVISFVLYFFYDNCDN